MKLHLIIAPWVFAIGTLAFCQPENKIIPDAPAPITDSMAMDSSSILMDPSAASIERSTFGSSNEKSRASRITWIEHHSLDLALTGSLGYDMYWTYQNMTHPLTVTFNTCNAYGAWEMTTAQCFADPNHTIGTSRSGINPIFFSEAGWTKIFGDRNVGMTIAGQTLEDTLLIYTNHRLSKQGRVSRLIGKGLMVYKTTGHFTGAHNNITGISYAEHFFVPEGAWNVRWF